jgi:hypothetical protein
MSTTLLALEQLLDEQIGDFLEFDTTTNLTTGSTAKIYSNTLKSYDNSRNDFFNNWWAYITEGLNAGVLRKVKDYISTNGEVKLYGSAFLSTNGAVTCRLHRLNRDNKIRALKRSIEHIYPHIYIPLDDQTLVGGNILPDAHFEWWTSTSALKFYTTSNLTLTQTSTAGKTRGGKYSVYGLTGAANGNFYISSNTYPRLLDLQGRSVSVYVWVYPQKLDDCTIIIDTVSLDGTTTQTLTSATSCPATYWTLLKLENQTLNDDLQEVKITFNTATIAQYSYWDDALVIGKDMYEYLLPSNFQTDFHLSQVNIQSSGYSDIACYDLRPLTYGVNEEVNSFDEEVNGTIYKFIRFLNLPTSERRIRLTGYKMLEVPTTDAGTISLDGRRLNLLLAYAAHLLYQLEMATPSAEDRTYFEKESMYWLNKYNSELPQLMMTRPADYIRTGI